MPTAAAEFQQLSDNLYHWSVFDPEVKCDLSCVALNLANGLVVIDPAPLAESAWKELTAVAALRAILLTNGNHVRDTLNLKKKYPVPVVAAPATRKEITELKVDVVLLDYELLYGLSSIPIPGATVGETAFHAAQAGVLVLGDSIINIDPVSGMQLLPAKYCVNAEQSRDSLKKLLSLDFHTLAFAHGLPVTQNAKEKLASLLNA